jgi:hypothetical protein
MNQSLHSADLCTHLKPSDALTLGMRDYYRRPAPLLGATPPAVDLTGAAAKKGR